MWRISHIYPVALLIGDERRYGFNPQFSEFWSNVVLVVVLSYLHKQSVVRMELSVNLKGHTQAP